jgi:hypothetical protein
MLPKSSAVRTSGGLEKDLLHRVTKITMTVRNISMSRFIRTAFNATCRIHDGPYRPRR